MAVENPCKDCRAEVGNRSPRCAGCTEKHKKKMRDLRKRQKKADPDLCPRCRLRKKEGGLQACFQCAFETDLEPGQVEDWVELWSPIGKKNKWRSAKKLV